jgi:hypothetical protein
MIWLKKCFESENAKNAVFRSKKLNYAAFKWIQAAKGSRMFQSQILGFKKCQN